MILQSSAGPSQEELASDQVRYADLETMVVRFGQDEMVRISNRNRSALEINAEVVWRAIDDASAEVDSYLGRYTLPLAAVPRVLINVTCDIARYRLYDDRATDQVTRRYTDAVRMLEKVARGDLQLGMSAAQTVVPTTGGPQVVGPDRVFSAATLKDY